jgi:hypothetical protein
MYFKKISGYNYHLVVTVASKRDRNTKTQDITLIVATFYAKKESR